MLVVQKSKSQMAKPNLLNPKKLIDEIPSPFSRYADIEGTSGIILLFCAIAALIIANSGLGHGYHELLETDFIIGFGEFAIEKPLHIWINDGLMAIFFFYVGLEIKREVKVGELSVLRQAMLPFFAAIGGMVVPAGLFLILHGNQPGADGWGVPMATDIAFSLGLLMLLGDRVPTALKVFLTAFAIVDDIGAILVIALYYSSDVQVMSLIYAGGFYVLLIICNQLSLRKAWVYSVVGIIIWYFFLRSGVHPTVAGILVALVIPSNTRIKMTDFVRTTQSALKHFLDANRNAIAQFLSKEQLVAISDIEDSSDKVQPPLQRLENMLHPHVAFLIMPIFALANAGVSLQPENGVSLFSPLSINILIGLVLGKVIGIVLFTWLSVRLGLADLPENSKWAHFVGLGFMGGIGFTMSLFIANLAFGGQPDQIVPAKLGILLGSAISGILGLTILYLTLDKRKAQKLTEHEEPSPVIQVNS